MDRDYVATKDDWQISPMPKKNTEFILKRKFSDNDINKLKKGHIPEEMEDRWFSYYLDDKLYIHRSWSGTCIFILEVSKKGKHKVIVNRDDNEYANDDLDEDIELINDLLNGWTY